MSIQESPVSMFRFQRSVLAKFILASSWTSNRRGTMPETE